MPEWFAVFKDEAFKRAVVMFVTAASAYFSTHGFHHWGIDITVHINNQTLEESLIVGLPTIVAFVHHKLSKAPAAAPNGSH